MNSSAAIFATTHWSVVLAAGQLTDAQGRGGWERLYEIYWYPLYAYIRRRGYGVHDAQDLTQGFFAHLLGGPKKLQVEPGKGKFRSFLLTALKHFLADEYDRAQAKKRGGGQEFVSFEKEEAERRYQLEGADNDSPERLFDRRWAVAVTDYSVGALEQEYQSKGKGELFSLLYGALVEDPAADGCAAMARRLGMTDVAVRKAAQRLRQRYREVLWETIRQTVSSDAEAAEELRYLRAVLGRG